jgi:4-hydroxy-3-methylbut-2-enyl diphosphate reductase
MDIETWEWNRVRALSASSPILTVKRVLIANPHGYCAGVLFALRGADLARQIYADRPVWVFHEIVHNPDPVNELRAMGVNFCDSIADAPDGAVLLYSAHGVSPAVRAEAESRNFHAIIDLTCPLVARVHDAVKKNANGQIILVGKRTHDETVGTMGEVPEHTYVVSSVEDVERLELDPHGEIVFITQTTWSVHDAGAIIDAICRRYPSARPAISVPPTSDGNNLHGSICYATENRQQAVIAGARQADVTIVIGGDRSENTASLVHTAERAGTKGYRITSAYDIREEWLAGARTVLISSGASTPEYRLEEVIAWFRERGVVDIQALGEPEPMQLSVPEGFALPPGLRASARRFEQETGSSLQPLSRAAQPWRGTEM